MEDRHVVATALAAWIGALAGAHLPAALSRWSALVLVGLLLVVALRRAHRVAIVALVGLLACVLGARAWAGIDAPTRGERWEGTATLVTDPIRIGAGWKAELRLDDRRHVEAFAYGTPAWALRDRLAGERVRGRGRLSPPPTTAQHRLAVRHVVARASLEQLEPLDGGAPWWRCANALRRTLERGASSLGPDRQALWSGLVYGDDRAEDPGVEADFSVAGLSHLLSVSGQNVAFALAAAGPLLRRLRLRPRLVASIAVLALFGVAVRFEPSVLRAAAMAGLALSTGALGVTASSIRLVGLAVTGLVLVDPLLVHRLGFQLSVAATVGIALWSGPLSERLRGPRWLREAAATALAAQAAVSPLLLGLGGSSPIAIPANVVAVPAAGPVMVWGLTGGTLAGLTGEPFATILHVPDRLLLGWLAGVAHVAAQVPLRPVGLLGLVATAVLVGLAVVSGRFRRALVAAAVAAFVLPTTVPVAAGAAGPTGTTGLSLWRAEGTTVVVLAPGDPARVVAGLRTAGVRGIDLLVVEGTGPAVLAVVAAVLERHEVDALVGRASVDIEGLTVLDVRHPARAGPFAITVDRRGKVTVVDGDRHGRR